MRTRRWIPALVSVLCSLAVVPSIANPVQTPSAHGGPIPHPNEAWSSPDRAQTHLTPQPPFVEQTDTKPRFTRQVVQVQWRMLDPIYLYIVKPIGIAKPPAVLYLYGYPADASRFLDDGYCERLTRHGCAAVGFESALTGSRYRYRPMHEWFVSELPEALSESAHDVQYILDYLATRGDLDMTRIGMFGEGSGGTIAILAAGADPRIKALDLLNPWGDWPDWMKTSTLVPANERPRYLIPAFLSALAPLEPAAWLPRLKGRPIRLQWVKDDTDVPDACRDTLTEAAPSGAQVAGYDDNVALFTAEGGGRLFSWLAQQLNPRPATTVASGGRRAASRLVIDTTAPRPRPRRAAPEAAGPRRAPRTPCPGVGWRSGSLFTQEAVRTAGGAGRA